MNLPPGLVAAHRDGLSWWTRDALLDTPAKKVWQWDTEEVCRWLSIVDGMEEEWIQCFEDHHVTGVRLLRMNANQLVTVGIDSGGAAAKLVDEIMMLRKWGVSKHVHRYVVEDDEQPANIFEGIFYGVIELLRGIAEGVVGISRQF
eukprot:COSAG01_NODE_34346_length_549_cov_0.964444_1_plen_146_part_00